MFNWFKLLPIGSVAPLFRLMSQTGESVGLEDFKGKKHVVLVFYPGDGTPVCTAQLCAFRDRYEVLSQAGIEVFGINPADWESHRNFAEKNHLTFPILYDPLAKVAKQYKATLIPRFLNNRVVYAIDCDGVIRFAAFGQPPIEQITAALPG